MPGGGYRGIRKTVHLETRFRIPCSAPLVIAGGRTWSSTATYLLLDLWARAAWEVLECFC